MTYLVIQRGGSIGEVANLRRYHGQSVYASFDNKKDAMDCASKARKHLSKGEKKYYKMGYNVVPVKNYEKQ